jgi:hypothetical protein
MSVTRFFAILFIISLAAAAIAYFVEGLDASNAILVPYFWPLLVFLSAITLLAFFLASKAIKTDAEASIYVIMGVSISKLLLCMTLVLVYSLKVRVNAVFFALEFFSLYFLFTSFEVYALLCNLRHQNKT